MIRSLRNRHRAMIALLAAALVALFIAAMVARQPAPVAPKLPDVLLKPEGDKR